MKNIRVFLSENFQFLEMKCSIYLNRRDFSQMFKKYIQKIILAKKIESRIAQL